MKKIFAYIGLALAVISCNLYENPGESIPVKTSDGVYITVDQVKDSSVVFSLTPKGTALFYSYLVDENDVPEELDSMDLYQVKYTSLAQGTVKWSREKNTETITLDGLLPNTTYQIYAVAGSETGIPSKVEALSFTTTDHENPAIDDFLAKEDKVMIQFSEPVVYKSLPMTVRYFAENTRGYLLNQEMGSLEIPVDSIALVEPDVVLIKLPEMPSGAYYAIDFEDHTFEDLTQHPIKGLASGFMINEEQTDIDEIGVTGRISPKTFALEKNTISKFKVWNQKFVVVPESSHEYPIADMDAKAKLSMTYELGSKLTTYQLKAKKDFGLTMIAENQIGLQFVLPEEPDNGSTVKMELPEGLLSDIYGNTSEVWSFEAVYSIFADILGKYSVTGFKLDGEDVGELPWEIAPSDDPTKGNVMVKMALIATFPNFDLGVVKVYADYNPDTDELILHRREAYAGGDFQGIPVVFSLDFLAVDEYGDIIDNGDPGNPDYVFLDDCTLKFSAPGVFGENSAVLCNSLYMDLTPFGGEGYMFSGALLLGEEISGTLIPAKE